MKLDDRCATCNHHEEQHIKGICRRCKMGKALHQYKRKGSPA